MEQNPPKKTDKNRLPKKKIMKKTFLIKSITFLILISSCTSVRKMTTEKEISTNSLNRSEYTISDDKVAEASVTQTLGLFYNNKDAKLKKGIIKMHTGNLTIGNFNLNISGVIFASTVTLGSGYLLNNYDFASSSFIKHSDMVKPNSNATYTPTVVSYALGAILGFGLNALIAPSPNKKAESLAKYNFINDNNYDYIINPRFELCTENNFFKKTAKVKLTAKGMNIKTDK